MLCRARKALTCEFIAKGTFDDSITHNRDSIPKALPLDVEARLMDDQRFPALTGPNGLFTGSGLHDSTRVGYLVVVPGTGFGIDFGDLLDTSGATTVDLQRQWRTVGKTGLSLLADGTDGRLIGWTSLSVESWPDEHRRPWARPFDGTKRHGVGFPCCVRRC